ncbi:MAG: RNA-binding protein, partial [Firmicutes bacterium]|nr:RNA-binding protein [Bacillota bacterium]
YAQAGHTALSCEIRPLSDLRPAAYEVKTCRDTVASLRLDSVLASMFSSSRGHAQEAIRQGLVAVNNRIVLKPDHFLQEGDKVSLRGKGKAVLVRVGGKSRKDRDCIEFERYL